MLECVTPSLQREPTWEVDTFGDQEKAIIVELFAQCDADGSGVLEMSEIDQLLTKITGAGWRGGPRPRKSIKSKSRLMDITQHAWRRVGPGRWEYGVKQHGARNIEDEYLWGETYDEMEARTEPDRYT